MTTDERAIWLTDSLLEQAESKRPFRFANWRRCDIERMATAIATAIREAEAAATLRERERCARVAEDMARGAASDPSNLGWASPAENMAEAVASAIRRGQPASGEPARG